VCLCVCVFYLTVKIKEHKSRGLQQPASGGKGPRLLSKVRNGGGGGGGGNNKVHESVRKIFLDQLRKKGVALTAHQLLDEARRRKLPVPSLAATFRFIREDVPELVGYAGGRVRPKQVHFQTIGVSRPGVFFVDYAEFQPQWSGHNNGCTGFLLAVENLTNRLFAAPTRGKDTRQWLEALAKFLERTDNVRLVFSDRDSVAQSEVFRDRLAKKYGIAWKFLGKDNKSYLAERYIGFLKRRLGMGLRARGQGSGAKRWIDLVNPICDAYNKARIPGTSYRRNNIDVRNFDNFVAELFKVKDPTVERYNCFKAGPFATKAWNDAIFKFDVGDKVSVLKTAVWKLAQRYENMSKYAKRSTTGAFSQELFTVAGRQLRANRQYTHMIPVYSLRELGPGHLNFYETQLRPAVGSAVRQPPQQVEESDEEAAKPWRQQPARGAKRKRQSTEGKK